MFKSTSKLMTELNKKGLLSFAIDGQIKNQSLLNLFNSSKPSNKVGESRLFYNHDDYDVTLVKSLGGKPSNETLRMESAKGLQELKKFDVDQVFIDHNSHDVAVGTNLSTFKYSLKTKGNDNKKNFEIKSLQDVNENNEHGLNWKSGEIYADAQNLARELMEMPSNYCTPTYFCERAQNELKGIDNVTVQVFDEEWAKSKNMNTFLSVAAGTDQPAKFLQVNYNGGNANDRPLALVGKGITFDSGGISIKGGAGMKLMKGDMGGAATLFATTLAIAKLKLPINVVYCAPLTENLPSGKATKPGDIITTMSGQTVEVDNTDAEGRLVLSDALYYASTEFDPHTVIDAATLTGAQVIALGDVYTGVFSSTDSLFNKLNEAGQTENDLMWRMPLNDSYLKQIDGTPADLCNTGGRPAGACTAAIFLKQFVDGINGDDPKRQWAHCDIAGTMECNRPEGYNTKGMSGRPTRALIEYARQLSKNN